MSESDLQKLEGRVTNLKVERVAKDILKLGLQNKAGVAAVGAAAVGALANAAVFTNLAGRLKDDVETFSCEVNGVQLSGCFGGVTFEEGDAIEFIVEYNPDDSSEAAVHAARDRKRKILSMLPYQDMGEKQYKKTAMRFDLGFSITASSLMILIVLIVAWVNDFGETDISFLKMTIPVAIGGGVVVFILLYTGRKKAFPFAKNATNVLAALGYKNPPYASPFHNDFDAECAYSDAHNVEVEGLPQWVNRYQDSDLEK